MIEFLNKAEYNLATKSWQAYRNDLLQWSNWGDKKLVYKPPALLEYKRGLGGISVDEIYNMLKKYGFVHIENQEYKAFKSNLNTVIKKNYEYIFCLRKEKNYE